MGGDEGARLERGILKSAVKPHTQLPANLEGGECGAVISGERVAGGVARPPYFPKKLSNVARDDPLFLQSANEFVLWFLGRDVEPNPARHMLGEQLRQLAQLEQR